VAPPSRGNRRWVVLGVVLAVIACCLGIPLGMWQLLRGEPARVERPTPTRRTQQPSTVTPTPRWDEPGCAIPIHVGTVYDLPGIAARLDPPLPEGLPIPTDVDLSVAVIRGDSVFLGQVSAGDTISFGDQPCSVVQYLHLEKDGSVLGGVQVMGLKEAPLVPLVPTQTVHVVVVDADTREPIEGAWLEGVWRGAPPTDARGRTTLHRPIVKHWSTAMKPDGYDVSWQCGGIGEPVHAEGYHSGHLEVPGCDGKRARKHQAPFTGTELPELEVVVELESGRTVYVHCLDRNGEPRYCPGDLTCLPSWSVELGRVCQSTPTGVPEEREEADRCYCPETEAVIRGLGRSLTVPDGEEDVFIELDGTGVTGQIVPEDGQTTGCSVVAERVASELSDLGSIGAVGRIRGECDARNRTFKVEGLTPGDWVLEVKSREVGFPDEKLAVAVPVPDLQEGELRDVGGVDVHAGSSLTVRCIDGLTGDELDDLAAFILHDGASYEVGYAQAVGCGRTQLPVLSGEWDVFVLPYAHVRSHLTLRPGEDAEVELVVGDDDTVEAIGATLGLTRDGLEVLSVAPGGPLASAGVVAGDAIVDISAFGMPLPIDNYAAEVMSGVLGIWGTAGVSVQVESAASGERYWVELE
jgi:hypothetical protein